MKMQKIKTYTWLFFVPLIGFLYMFWVLSTIWYKDMKSDYEICHYGSFGEENELLKIVLFLVVQVTSCALLTCLTH